MSGNAQEVKCVGCAQCCKVITLSAMIPPGREEFMRVHFGHEVKRWSVMIQHRCKQLDENDRCRIYETRPQHCREFYCGSPGLMMLNENIIMR